MAFLGCVGLVLTAASFQASADFKAEYDKLQREYEAAQDAYFEPYAKAKSDEERAKIVLDPAKEPSNVFTPKFEELAKRAKGTETGARSLLWLASNVREPGSPVVLEAVDTLVAEYLDSPLLAELAQWMQYGAESVGAERAETVLGTLVEKSPHADVRAGALYALGAVRHEAGEKEKSVEALRKLEKEYAGSASAIRAASLLFEIEKLQIGMVAPDFTCTDEKGETWKLSDYKGKVVVIDFWGFW